MSKLIDDLKKLKKPGRGWTFTAKALLDIAEARAINDAGDAYIGLQDLAAALKREYGIPVKAATIAKRITEIGGKW